MRHIPERIALVTEDQAAAERARALGIPVITVEQLLANLKAGSPDDEELTVADVDRVVAANPELDYPGWVEAELRAREAHVHVAGEAWDGGDPLGAVVHQNAERWAYIGGARAGDIITAQVVNRGKLIEILHHDTKR